MCVCERDRVCACVGVHLVYIYGGQRSTSTVAPQASVSVWVCAQRELSKETRRGVRFPGSGVPGGCASSDVGAGN